MLPVFFLASLRLCVSFFFDPLQLEIMSYSLARSARFTLGANSAMQTPESDATPEADVLPTAATEALPTTRLELLAPAGDLAALQAEIDSTHAPHSRPLEATAHMTVRARFHPHQPSIRKVGYDLADNFSLS